MTKKCQLKMKVLCFIISAIVLSVFTGCADNSEVLLKAESVMLEQPDSALSLLEDIDPRSLKTKQTRAKYALLLSQAKDKCFIDETNDSLIRVAVDYYSGKGTNIDKAKAYYYYSVVKNNAFDFDDAVKYLIIAREYVEQTDDSCLKGLIYSYLGSLYLDQYSFDEAVEAYSCAVAAFDKTGNKRNLLYAMYNKGLALNMAGDYNSAIEVLSNAQDVAFEIQDIKTVLNIISSIGGIKIMHNSDVSSLRQYKVEIFDVYRQFTDGQIPIEHYPFIGYIYLEEGKIDSAYMLYNQYYTQQTSIQPSNVGVLAMLSKIEFMRKNYKAAYEYECSYTHYMDSINENRQNDLIQNLEKKYKTEYLEESYKALTRTHKYAMRIWTLGIILILVIGGVIISYYRIALYRKKQEVAECEQYIEEGKNLYTDLVGKYEKIKAHMNVQDERSQTLFVVLGNRIESLKQLLEWASIYEKNTDNFYKRFKDHIKVAAGKNKELTDDVITIANMSCNGVIDYLYDMHPTLSRHELCYCGFICLGFSPESIRILYNHTNPYSIYTMRSKIRNKIGIKNNAMDLESYILSEMERLNRV